MFKKLKDKLIKNQIQVYRDALRKTGFLPAFAHMYKTVGTAFLMLNKHCPDCEDGLNIPEKTLCPTCFRFWNDGVCYSPIRFGGDFFDDHKELIDSLGLPTKEDLEKIAIENPFGKSTNASIRVFK